MAILRNREVTILGRADGADMSPQYTVQYPDLEREIVRLSDLQMTEDEYKEMTRQNGEEVMVPVKKIENKDLQALRDGQDRAKIEENQRKNPTPEDITVRSVKVDAGEVVSQLPKNTVNKAK
jgi:hypothetical protein